MVQLHDVDEAHAFGTWRDMAIFIWRTETHTPAVESASQVLTQWMCEHPRGIGLMQVIERTALPPDDSARTAISEMLRRGVACIQCSSVVHEGSGFAAAMVRGVVTGITNMSKPAFPHVVFAGVEEAAIWHMKLLASDHDRAPEPLLSAVAELRRELHKRSNARSSP